MLLLQRDADPAAEGAARSFGGDGLADTGRVRPPTGNGDDPTAGGSVIGLGGPGQKRRRVWPVWLGVTVVLVLATAFFTNKIVYPDAYNAGVRHDQVQASVRASVAASKSAAAVPPTELNCPQRHSDDAIRAVNGGYGFIDKQVVVVSKPAKDLLVIFTEPRVFVRAPVSGDIRVCGDRAVLILEVPLPDTARIFIGGGSTAIALVDGVPEPQHVWFGNLHPQIWPCAVQQPPTKDHRPCSQYYAGPDTVIPGTSATPRPSPTR